MASAASPRPVSSSSRAIAPLAPLPGVSAAASPTESATSPTTPQSLTAKQWIIPPRPKPGRKPATDTPPTKRKAQNRAAQRAFRERRAAKVGELEEHIEEIEKEHESIIEAFKSELDSLKQDLEQSNQGLSTRDNQLRLLHAEVAGWNEHCKQLEDQVRDERRCRLSLESELAVMRGEAVRLPARGSQAAKQNTQLPTIHKNSAEHGYHTPEETTLGCSKCSLERCQCLDSALGVGDSSDRSTLIKRSASPAVKHSQGKRMKRISRDNSPAPLFNDGPLQLLSSGDGPSGPESMTRPVESCGFCQDGSTCPCAELAAEADRLTEDHGSRLPSPPREPTENVMKPVSAKGKSNESRDSVPTSCNNKPGTCSQCQTDSKSKQFCQGLAKTTSLATVPAPIELRDPAGLINTIVPCAAGQACCRISSALSSLASGSGAAHQTHLSNELDFTTPSRLDERGSVGDSSSIYKTSQAVTGPTLSCADAFTTLAKHPAFDEAAKDYGEWLPKLATVPGARSDTPAEVPTNTPVVTPGGPLEQIPARTAFDIEAASVMGVLRFFDRRFGRGN